jgi:hypothetical protein
MRTTYWTTLDFEPERYSEALTWLSCTLAFPTLLMCFGEKLLVCDLTNLQTMFQFGFTFSLTLS